MTAAALPAGWIRPVAVDGTPPRRPEEMVAVAWFIGYEEQARRFVEEARPGYTLGRPSVGVRMACASVVVKSCG